MLIRCYVCEGTGYQEITIYNKDIDEEEVVSEKCSKCQGNMVLMIPDIHDVLEACTEQSLEQGQRLELLLGIYTRSLEVLGELERRYNRALLANLDFESRTALDKQERKILQEDARLLELSEHISHLKAVLRACSFSLEILKLNAKAFAQGDNGSKPEKLGRPDVKPEPTKTVFTDAV